MEVGPAKEKFLIEQARLNRQPIPDRVANAPILSPGLSFYMRAWDDLGTCRGPAGMALGRIMWTAVNDFALRFGLDEAEFEILWELIKRLDGAYLDWQSKQKPIKERKSVKEGEGKKEPKFIHTGKRA